jgi:DNA-binding MarR family transcriptional regulator
MSLGKSGVDHVALSDFRYEIRRFLNFSEQAAHEAGIGPHQHQALLALAGLRAGQKATVGLLAERLQVRHHSAVELVNRLEKKRLIRRSRNRADRREVLLGLTDRGERILRGLTIAHRAELRSAGPKLLRALRAVITHSKHDRAPERETETDET